jgi:uncharacterized SAM-binding protein YcdF (DUF218 family)
MPTELQPADAIVVHGGNLSRTRYGIDLYQRGLAPELWHTGFTQDMARNAMLSEMIAGGGIPPAAFSSLASTSTWTDAAQIAQAARARGAHRLLVITDWWHSRRAICADRQQLRGVPVAIFFAPAPSPAGPDRWWQDAWTCRHVVVELVKLGYYALRYGLRPWDC